MPAHFAEEHPGFDVSERAPSPWLILLVVLGLAGCQTVERSILEAHLSADELYAHAQVDWQGAQYQSAEKYCRAALRKQPNHYGALTLLAETDVQIASISMGNNQPSATKRPKDASDISSDYNIQLTRKEESARLDEAVQEYREAAQVQPTKPEPHHGLARVWELQGDREQAIAEYREAVRLNDPRTPAIHVSVGMLLKAKGDSSGALAEFEEALRVMPNYPSFTHSPVFKRSVERYIEQTR